MRKIVVALALIAATGAAAQAQHRKHSSYFGSRVPGDSTCRAIWDEFGRQMSGHQEAVYCELRDVGTRPAPATIEADGGARAGVAVRGEDRRDMRLQLVIQAQAGTVAEAKSLAQRVALDTDARTLRVTGLTSEWRRHDDDPAVFATLLITAPKHSNVTARVDYAALSVEDVQGTMDLRTDHGPLDLRNVGGDVRARVEYGPIDVALDGMRWEGTQLDAEAEYGPVTLKVPRGFNADLEIGADHGPFEVDFPLTVTQFSGSTIATKLGAGGPKVRAVARYGPMEMLVNR